MKRGFAQLVAMAAVFTVPAVAAGYPRQESSSKQQQPPEPPAHKQQAAKGADAPAAEAQPQVPASAAEDIDIGNFYLHKGDVDAAIDRYQDAIQVQPRLGKPRLLIAEAYEKKHDAASAAKYYKEYLQVFPHAPDAKRIQEKIQKLSER